MAIQINTTYPIFGGTLNGTTTEMYGPYLEYAVKPATYPKIFDFDKDNRPSFCLEKEIYIRSTFINPKNDKKITVYIFKDNYDKLEQQILQYLSEHWGLYIKPYKEFDKK
jgi:hypothetical protein